MLLPRIFIIINFHYTFIECLIPDLNVQRVDRKLIQKRRQDTLEMCRLFNAETQRLEQIETNNLKTNDVYNKRIKRNADIDNTEVNVDKAKMIESIVDKLYDEEELEKGEQVIYRHRSVEKPTTIESIKNITVSRRFDFAPASLTGPVYDKKIEDDKHKTEDKQNRIPWHKTWKHGIIPYFVDSRSYDNHLIDVIRKAFDYFEKVTCIRLQRLRERPMDRRSLEKVEWLYISNPTGVRQCVHSNPSKPNKGVQTVVLGYKCMSVGEIAHELMHVLGFSHEHTRSDRNHHISVLWDNIKPGYKKYFEIRPEDVLTSFPYDHLSVLHYPSRAFSKNGQVTILTEPGVRIGQRDGISEIDAHKVDMIFGNDCMERNRNYLLKTCPSVVKSKPAAQKATKQEIEDYFEEKLWPYGIINYKIKDKMEFNYEEIENINAVIQHIEKETCIEFREMNAALKTEYNMNPASSNELKATKGKEMKSKIDEGDDEIQGTENKKSEKDNEIRNSIENFATTTPRSTVDSTDDSRRVASIKVKNNTFVSTNVTNSTQTRRSVQGRPVSPSRRHATDILVLTRSTEPGCQCPSTGRPNSVKELRINLDCFNSVNDLLHLFVHVLGLDHQHNMHDRDSYLHILWDKLSPEINTEMSKTLPAAASVGFSYDYQSVMHYPWLQIKNGVSNIMYPIWNDGWAMGHWQGLSSIDVQKINVLYEDQCDERRQQAEGHKKYNKN